MVTGGGWDIVSGMVQIIHANSTSAALVPTSSLLCLPPVTFCRPQLNRWRCLRTSMFLPWLKMLFVIMAIAGCATNPYTHRHQLELVPASQEQAMGVQAYNQVLHDPKVKISHDPREVEPVKRVAARIIEAAKVSLYAETAKQFEWQVSVIKDDKNQNAFALPGGKIAVYTGIFPVAQNEARSEERRVG